MRTFILTMLMALSLSANAQVYKDPSASINDRVDDLLQRMTLEEKIDYIGGYNGFYIRDIKRLGLPEIKLTDGPVGTHKDGKSTAYPAGVLTASTWNRDLVFELGRQLGRDSRARGVNILLGPAMNIIRSPLCGRNFEYFTEDPYLNGETACAYVNGLQSQHVVATLKHFVANNQEWDRNNASSDLDERTLHEIYLQGFRNAICKANAGAVMDSYNPVNGVHSTENGYLNNEVLRKQWGFDGIVMSDWSATYDAVKSATGGLDLEMPRGKFMNKVNLIPAIRDGKISEEIINEKVRHILNIIFRFGFFDHTQKDTTIPLDNPEGCKTALQLAREGIVLLKNENNILPIGKNIKKIAVIGPNANSYISGGGSSYTFPFHSVTLLDGLKKEVGDVEILYSPGLPTLPETVSFSVFYTEKGSITRGLKAEYYNNSQLQGKPASTHIDTLVNIANGYHIATENRGLPYDHCSMRWSGIVRPTKDADYRFIVRGFDGFRLKIADEMVINEWHDQGITTREVVISLKKGKEYPVVLEYFANVHPVDISFGWREEKLLFDEATSLARQADIALVSIGFNESLERESNDRTFELPQYQDSLIQCVAKANPRTVVLLNAGGNVDMSKWISQVPAILHLWYPGQEGGQAAAEILTGKISPSGKLPMTFERKWEDNPTYPYYHDEDNDKHVRYGERIYLGYRYYDTRNISPRFAFGHGLSYTTFKYDNLKIRNKGTKSNPLYEVSFTVENTGNMDAAETAQIYIHSIDTKVDRPYKELKGYEKKFIHKGEKVTYRILLDKDAFSYYSVDVHNFVAEKGRYKILVGTASDKILLDKEIRY